MMMQLSHNINRSVFGRDEALKHFNLHALDVKLDKNPLRCVRANRILQRDDSNVHHPVIRVMSVEAALICRPAIKRDRPSRAPQTIRLNLRLYAVRIQVLLDLFDIPWQRLAENLTSSVSSSPSIKPPPPEA